MAKTQLGDIKQYSSLRNTGKVNIPFLDAKMSDYCELSDRELQAAYLTLAEDSHLNSELAKRVNAVSGLEYAFNGDKSGTKWKMFNKMVDFNQLISSMLQSILYGYSAIQIIWAKDGSTTYPESFKLRPNYLFNRTIDDDITIYRTDGDIKLEVFDLNQWIIHKHNYNAPIPYLNGVMRSLAHNLVYKRIALNDRDRFNATYGIPIKVGHYPIGSSTEQEDLFLKFINNMTSSASGCLPEGFTVDIITAGTADSTVFEKTISYTDNQINLAINGGTMSSVNTNAGSRALGEVLDKGRLELINDDAKQVVNTINKQLLPLLFGKYLSMKVPELMIVTETEVAGNVDNNPDNKVEDDNKSTDSSADNSNNEGG
jgi:phage gp29-like protein